MNCSVYLEDVIAHEPVKPGLDMNTNHHHGSGYQSNSFL